MDPAAITPGQRAHVDQMLALINEVDKAWPFNQQLLNDDEIERVFLDRPREEWSGRADRAHLLWANGRAVELDHALTPHDIHRQVTRTSPSGESECDRCRVVKVPAGVAVVAMPPSLIPLVLCPDCANHLNPDVLIPTTKE